MIRATLQGITVVVDGRPCHVGVDPRALLVDLRSRDSLVEFQGAGTTRR